MTDPVNWPRVIRELQESGFTLREIAKHSGWGYHNLLKFSYGDAKEPGYSRGVSLLAMHGRRSDPALMLEIVRKRQGYRSPEVQEA